MNESCSIIQNYKGHIELIFGPMFSGKTSELIRRVKRYSHAKKSCLILNYAFDNRYSNESAVVTHDKCELYANNGKIVIIAALDGTFERKPFGNVLNLLPMAEYICKLSAVCVVCSKDACFTKRIVDCKEIELIGGEEIYKPVCRYCFYNDSSTNSGEDSPNLSINSTLKKESKSESAINNLKTITKWNEIEEIS